jgi:hypothetical protein
MVRNIEHTRAYVCRYNQHVSTVYLLVLVARVCTIYLLGSSVSERNSNNTNMLDWIRYVYNRTQF